MIPVLSVMSNRGQNASPTEKSGSNASTPSAIRLRSGERESGVVNYYDDHGCSDSIIIW